MDGATQVVEAFLDAFTRRDVDGLVACLSEDVYFVPSGHELARARGNFSGREGFRRWWDISGAARWEVHGESIEELGPDRVFAELQVGTGDASAWTSVRTACVYTVGDGRISAIEVFVDSELAYERARRPIAASAGWPS